jgi:hypothetical protein
MPEIQQIDIVLALLRKREEQHEVQLAETRALSAKIDASRAEGAQRGAEQTSFNGKIERDVSAVRHEVRNVSQRLIIAEEEIESLKEADARNARDTSEVESTTEAAIGGAMAHVSKLDAGFAGVKAEIATTQKQLEEQNQRSAVRTASQDETNAMQGQVNHAVCSTLGIDYTTLTNGTARNETEALAKVKDASPNVGLVKIASENRLAAVIAFLTLLTVLGQIILKALGK